ncbi:hypothetical protein BO71DRAFT_435617 [Aspergillus ellipticus CBS 707.79]|uniref:Uncharacterized protein n=1 Tax=Aspergillus ellipticus CBS 707.79 TaxID=1448320 RepID=A0A319CVE4_9EURO|nr:hypothetical protein BO71DRAFT_435617 [Aspergillus ellipticus CBS 707.79]
MDYDPVSSETLDSEADYGRPPFDVFLSERWDAKATEEDQKQWERMLGSAGHNVCRWDFAVVLVWRI